MTTYLPMPGKLSSAENPKKVKDNDIDNVNQAAQLARSHSPASNLSPDSVPDAVSNAVVDVVEDAVADVIADAKVDAMADAVTPAVASAVGDAVPNVVVDAVPVAVGDAGANAVPDGVPDAMNYSEHSAVVDAVPDVVAGTVPDALTDEMPDAVPDTASAQSLVAIGIELQSTVSHAIIQEINTMQEMFDRLLQVLNQMLNNVEAHLALPQQQRIFPLMPLPRTIATEREIGERLMCAICCERFVLNDVVVKLPCAHIFHEHCIMTWLSVKATCPICRLILSAEDKTDPKGGSRDGDGDGDPKCGVGITVPCDPQALVERDNHFQHAF